MSNSDCVKRQNNSCPKTQILIGLSIICMAHTRKAYMRRIPIGKDIKDFFLRGVVNKYKFHLGKEIEQNS